MKVEKEIWVDLSDEDVELMLAIGFARMDGEVVELTDTGNKAVNDYLKSLKEKSDG